MVTGNAVKFHAFRLLCALHHLAKPVIGFVTGALNPKIQLFGTQQELQALYQG